MSRCVLVALSFALAHALVMFPTSGRMRPAPRGYILLSHAHGSKSSPCPTTGASNSRPQHVNKSDHSSTACQLDHGAEQTRHFHLIWKQASRRATIGSIAVALGVQCQALVHKSNTEAQAQVPPSTPVRHQAEEEELETRFLDDRKYKAVTLNNGLRVLIIEDALASRCAAAMNVNVGHFSDPDEFAGLAHFCEHMLFLGTRKFPQEDSFGEFLAKAAGSSNAFTDMEDTNYYFDVSPRFLEEGLDRFSQFFIAPLFTPSAVLREVNAIDSEHSKNLQSDSFRVFQLEKSRANPAHPYHKFGTGNLKTLLKGSDPTTSSTAVRNALLEFHKRYYSADRMCLCVYGAQPLDTLQDCVTRLFSSVPKRTKPLVTPPVVAPFPPQVIASEIISVPVRDLRQLQIWWPIPLQKPQARETLTQLKPDVCVAHLLGHEGKGSLLTYLRANGWATAVGASVSDDVSDFQRFEVVVDLTPKGLDNFHEIVGIVFSYLRGLRDHGIPKYVFEEISQLSSIAWNFSEKSEPAQFTSFLGGEMRKYPPKQYLSGPVLFRYVTLDPPAQRKVESVVYEYIAHLVPYAARITVLTKQVPMNVNVGPTLNEHWYGTQYTYTSKQDMKAQTLKWMAAQSVSALYVPPPNDFIPTRFQLLAEPKRWGGIEYLRDSWQGPTVIRDDVRWTVYYKQDQYFRQPKAYFICLLAMPEAVYNSKFVMQTKLFKLYVFESLASFLYDAQLAGLNFNLDLTSRGLQLTFSGYNDKLPVFVEKTLWYLNKLQTPTRDAYASYVDVCTREIEALKFEQPYAQAARAATLALETRQFTAEALNKGLTSCVRDDVARTLVGALNAGSRGTALVVGNISPLEALELVRFIEKDLPFEPSQELGSGVGSGMSRRRVAELPVAMQPLPNQQTYIPAGLLPKKGPNIDDGNGAVQVMFQVASRSPITVVVSQLLMDILEQPFYDTLRTKEQLGYIVFSGVKNREGYKHLLFVIQSSVAEPEQLTNRILAFLRKVPQLISELTDTQFKAFRDGLKTKKLEPESRLTSLAGRYWGEITADDTQFDRPQVESSVLDGVTVGDVLRFVQEHLNVSVNNSTRMMVTQIWPSRAGVDPAGDTKNSYAYVINDEQDFRATRPLLP